MGTIIQNRQQFDQCLSSLQAADVIAIDTETSGLHGKIIGISFFSSRTENYLDKSGYYLPIRHDHNSNLFQNLVNCPYEWVHELLPILSSLDKTFVFHNYKYDIQKLWLDDLDVPVERVFDTMIASWMVNENTPNSLDSCALEHLGRKKVEGIKKLADSLGGWEKVPPDVMGTYAITDAELTHLLYPIFKRLLEDQELHLLMETEMKFSRCLAQIERKGVRVDLERTKRYALEAESRMREIQRTLGFDPAKPSQLARKLYEAEPEGLGLLPQHMSARKLKTPILLSDGRKINHIPLMPKEVLDSYSHPVVDLVLEYRSRSKALSSYFSAYLTKSGPDQRIHPTFKHHGTVTSRLSCAEPNMQQIPRTNTEEQEEGVSKALVKTLFLAEEGYELWEFDYSQIEFRLAACYAKEPTIIQGYKEGKDFHQITAEVLNVDRYTAKQTNFAILYGAGPRKLAEQLWRLANVKLTESEAREVLSNWRGAYPRLQSVITEAERAASRGYIRYWDGRRRHFQFSSEHHKAFNSACQGGAARIVIKTMIQLQEEVPECPMVAQVHDALWIEVPIDGRDHYIEKIKKVMEWPSKDFTLEFPVDAHKLGV